MVRTIFALAFAACVGALPAAAFAEKDDDSNHLKAEVYVVEPGDTLGSIALRFRVGVSDVREWNNLHGDVRPGDRIVLRKSEERAPREPMPVVHVVRKGDTFEDIARKYNVSVSNIKKWNRRVDPRRMRIGQEIRLYIKGRDGKSVSWGSARRGRLYNGVVLRDSDGLRVRRAERAYGTSRTVAMLEAAAADVVARWPDAPSLKVGDISARRGGRLRPHKSHQSGRDADLSYYHRGNVMTADFLDMTPETFDAVKNWHIFKTLIDTGEVQFIFVDYRLQKVLYEYALSIGYTPDDLRDVLQYPNGRNARRGIIRHERGHDDHWHIRFHCGPHDKHCD